MNYLKERLIRIKYQGINALPVIIVSLFLFLSIYYLFGLKHVVMTAFLTLLFRLKHTSYLQFKEYMNIVALMIMIGCLSFIATIHIILCILLNFIVPFILVYIFTSKFTPKAYFVYMMEFVFLQFVPIPFSILYIRLIALVYGLCVVGISIWVYKRIVNDEADFHIVKKGLYNISCQIDNILAKKNIVNEKKTLTDLIYDLNRCVYTSRSYTSSIDGYTKINYLFLLFFQRFLYFTSHFEKEISVYDYQYFQTLRDLLYDMSCCIDKNNSQYFCLRIDDFYNTYQFEDSSKQKAMKNILHFLKYIINELEKTSLKQTQKAWNISRKVFSKSTFIQFFTLDLFQLRFALRISIVLCFTFLFCRLTGFNHAYWLPMSSFLMLMPYFEESSKKILHRLLGTICGAIVILIISYFIHSSRYYIFIVLIMTCFMYYVPVTSWTMSIFTTCYGLTLAMLSLQIKVAIELRIVYVFLGAFIVYLANYFLFPNTVKREFMMNVHELFLLPEAFFKEIEKLVMDMHNLNDLRHLIIHSRLIGQEIKNYSQSMSLPQKRYYQHIVFIHQKLMYEIEQIYSFLRYEENLKDHYLLKYILSSFKESSSLKNQIYDIDNEQNMYFVTLILNCLETYHQIENMKNDAYFLNC